MQVKICGLRSRADVAAAAEAGASYIGLVHFPKSPRHVTIGDIRWIAGGIPEGLKKVVLTVDADDETLDDLVEAAAPQLLQLHGSESPARVAEIRSRYGIPVMKAIGIAGAEDLAGVDEYAGAVDQVLLDARAPALAALPGGNGRVFDWHLLRGRNWPCPWMLAGGLTPENVAEAIRQAGAMQVDVSSGVESARGVKDHALIARFVKEAHRPPVAAA